MRMLKYMMILSILVLVGCGYSLQLTYESDRYFEHCMALDTHEEIKSPHKLQCWQTWLKDYTYGQTRDRIEFALRRIRALTKKIR